MRGTVPSTRSFSLLIPANRPQKVDVNALIEGRPAIHYASDYGQKEVIEYLITKGADVNVSYCA